MTLKQDYWSLHKQWIANLYKINQDCSKINISKRFCYKIQEIVVFTKIFQFLSGTMFTWCCVKMSYWLATFDDCDDVINSKGCRLWIIWLYIKAVQFVCPSSLIIVSLPLLLIHVASLSQRMILSASWAMILALSVIDDVSTCRDMLSNCRFISFWCGCFFFDIEWSFWHLLFPLFSFVLKVLFWKDNQFSLYSLYKSWGSHCTGFHILNPQLAWGPNCHWDELAFYKEWHVASDVAP